MCKNDDFYKAGKRAAYQDIIVEAKREQEWSKSGISTESLKTEKAWRKGYSDGMGNILHICNMNLSELDNE